MSSIEEFEKTLEHPSSSSDTMDERTRYRENEEEKARMLNTDLGGAGEVTPRLRHHEQQREKSEPSSEGKEGSRFLGDDKVKMLKKRGFEVKKYLQNAFQKGKDTGWIKWMMIFFGSIASLLLVGLMTMTLAKAFLPYPSHASCRVNITFHNDQLLKTGSYCDTVKNGFAEQMKKWESKENCKEGGMKCLYKVTDVGADTLKGTHKTSDWFGFVDEMTFTFQDTAQGDCLVEAYSRSTVPFAYFDFSVNYCNIHNLVEGYGFGRYEEVTSDQVCTQYSTANCEKY